MSSSCISFENRFNEFYSLDQVDDNTKKTITDIISKPKSSQSDAAIIAQNGNVLGAYFSRPQVGSIEVCGLLWWVKLQPTIYFAEGYLGQYLIIIPEKNIVAVRQIQASQNGQTNTFPKFINLVTQLAA